MFAKDSVYVHINVQDTKDKDAHIAGRVFLLNKVKLFIALLLLICIVVYASQYFRG